VAVAASIPSEAMRVANSVMFVCMRLQRERAIASSSVVG
jgi:hypothetical protein